MAQTDAERFIEVFRVAALQAGAVARHLQGEVRSERKTTLSGSAESEALTAVDLAAQDVVLHLLHRELGHVAVDAEEDTALAGLFDAAGPRAPLVVLDPVDGTLSYSRGSADYAVMGALVVDGVYEAALIHYPQWALTCFARRAAGCCLADAAGRPERRRTPARIVENLTRLRVIPTTRAAGPAATSGAHARGVAPRAWHADCSLRSRQTSVRARGRAPCTANRSRWASVEALARAWGRNASTLTEATMSTIEQSIEIDVPVSTAYNQWTQFEEFPDFMDGVEEVRQLDDRRLHWKTSIGGQTQEWDAEITEQHPDQRIAWHSTGGAEHAGVVTFHRLDDERCRVMLQMQYAPHGAVEQAGSALGLIERRVKQDLERFKEFIESRGRESGAWRGEIPAPPSGGE